MREKEIRKALEKYNLNLSDRQQWTKTILPEPDQTRPEQKQNKTKTDNRSL